MRLTVTLLIAGLCLTQPALSQTRTPAEDPAPVDRAGAVEAAADLKARAESAQVDGQPGADAEMQANVEQMAAVATLLEAKLREGKSRDETEPLYRELRQLRLDAIGMALSGQATLPAGAAEFDAELQKLERYQRSKN